MRRTSHSLYHPSARLSVHLPLDINVAPFIRAQKQSNKSVQHCYVPPLRQFCSNRPPLPSKPSDQWTEERGRLLADNQILTARIERLEECLIAQEKDLQKTAQSRRVFKIIAVGCITTPLWLPVVTFISAYGIFSVFIVVDLALIPVRTLLEWLTSK